MRRIQLARGIAAAILMAASLLAVSCSASSSSKAAKGYRFGTVTKGTIEKTVSSSGSLEAVSTVNVLSEMSGRVEKVNADYNDRVAKGQVLIELNTDMLKLQETQAQADVQKAKATYDLQRLDYDNDLKLSEKGLISDYALKTAKTNLDVAASNLASSQSALDIIEMKIKQYAYIKSPITGIVLERNVDVGQSVVEGSSSNSTSLFTLAGDISKMQIKTTVDELDIASIKKGQDVRFTVEALSGLTFTGKVVEVRMVPQTTNNVVNYYVIVSADNGSGKLLPGMTADVTFIESVQKDAFLVPNAALRYTPSALTAAQVARKTFEAGLAGMGDADREKALAQYDKQVAAAASSAEAKKSGTSGLTSLVMPMGGGPRGGGGPGGPGGFGGSSQKSSSSSSTTIQPSGAPADASGSPASGTAQASAGSAPSAQDLKTLWYQDAKGELQVLLVTAGSTNGSNTVVSGPGLDEGLKVILQEEVK